MKSHIRPSESRPNRLTVAAERNSVEGGSEAKRPTAVAWCAVACRPLVMLAPVLVLVAAFAGCSEQAVRSQSPEDLEAIEASEVSLVGDVAIPFGMQPIAVESIALVTGLNGTGSNPPEGEQRERLITEMQKRGVKNPNQVLASKNVALVLVRGFIKPGAREGDHFDLEVRVPARSETTSLRGGWLMETKMREMAYLGGALRDGREMAVAQGPILVDPDSDKQKDHVTAGKGRVLGGATVLKTQPLALVLKPEHQTVSISAQVGNAIGTRFNIHEHGVQQGASKAKTDQYIELAVHPRYKHNIPRYLQVVRSIPLHESTSKRSKRLKVLERQLFDPITSNRAALRLEAIGKEGIETLQKGIKADSQEVRFYSAEALAYLGEQEAAAELAKIAKDEPAFRVYALTALGSMDQVSAFHALRDLIDVPSAETRYGAFRALWTMDSRDPFVRGETLGSEFSYHVLDTTGSAFIHCTRSYRPEVVLFGRDQCFKTPLLLEAGPRIMVHSDGGDRVTVHRFAPGQPEEQRQVSTRVDEVVRAIVEVGGSYPDVVQALQQADAAKCLEGRFEIDALPQGGRTFSREASGAFTSSTSGEEEIKPAPEELATEPAAADEAAEDETETEDTAEEDADSDSSTKKKQDARDTDEEASRSWWTKLNPFSKAS